MDMGVTVVSKVLTFTGPSRQEAGTQATRGSTKSGGGQGNHGQEPVLQSP